METMKKSIHAWLSTLEPDLARRSINNAVNSHQDREFIHTTFFKTLHDAIKCSFLWSNTPEGFDYWDSVWKVHGGDAKSDVKSATHKIHHDSNTETDAQEHTAPAP